jgi:L-histidine N-alpha-methyltransferase
MESSENMRIREMAHGFIIEEPEAVDQQREFRDAVRSGLSSAPKKLPPRYLFDEEGSRLFEEITELPEHYQTRTERELLKTCSKEIISLFEGPIDLVELGRVNRSRARILIEEAIRSHGRVRYVPVVDSPHHAETACLSLLDDYPGLEVHVLACDRLQGLERIAGQSDHPKLLLCMGSSVGSMDRPEAALFLGRITTVMNPRDRFLAGIDLRKKRELLHRAYNDGHGKTAQFNRNILVRINRELGGDFDLNGFDHRAVYNEMTGAVQMFLLSRKDQKVSLRDLDMEIHFEAGESIHTENSYKYSLEEIYTMATVGGFVIERHWTDPNFWYTLNLMRV